MEGNVTLGYGDEYKLNTRLQSDSCYIALVILMILIHRTFNNDAVPVSKLQLYPNFRGLLARFLAPPVALKLLDGCAVAVGVCVYG